MQCITLVPYHPLTRVLYSDHLVSDIRFQWVDLLPSCATNYHTTLFTPVKSMCPGIFSIGVLAADAGQCQVPDSSPLRIGESLFHSSQIMRGTEAVDLCLVISTVSSMSNSQLWLQIAVPVLDGHLLTLGIGNGDLRNRYCLVTFGGNSATKFIRVNGETFFSYNQFFLARRQLSRSSGTTCDGYEAINFTISNAPFREHPNVAKVIVLVTDSDRTRPSTRSDLTRDVMLQTLYTRHIALDTVVSISLQLSEQRESTVLGFHGYRKASILRPDGGYEMSQNQSVRFTYAMGQTISDYVALSLALESSSWPLGLLDNEDYNTILSFANAFANAHGLFPALPVEVCEECRCGVEATLSCEQPVDQELCRCLINQTHSQVGTIIDDSRHIPPLLTENMTTQTFFS